MPATHNATIKINNNNQKILLDGKGRLQFDANQAFSAYFSSTPQLPERCRETEEDK